MPSTAAVSRSSSLTIVVVGSADVVVVAWSTRSHSIDTTRSAPKVVNSDAISGSGSGGVSKLRTATVMRWSSNVTVGAERRSV